LISDEITDLTGITNFHTDLCGTGLEHVLTDLMNDLHVLDCKHILAHNGKGFDKPFLEHHANKLQFYFSNFIWLDCMADIEWPYPSRKLSCIACELGFLHPFPHAAIFAAMTMFKCAETRGLDYIIKRATAPEKVLIANT